MQNKNISYLELRNQEAVTFTNAIKAAT